MTPAPTLTTQRLTLRGPVPSDLAPFTDMVVNSPRMAPLGGNDDATAAWRGFVAGIGHWHMRGYGFFTVVETATETPVGRVGILNHVGWPSPELAYHMFDNGAGRGMAFEACITVRHWAGATLGLAPLISLIAPQNARSIALSRRLGATQGDEIDHDGERAIVFQHLAYDAPDARAMYGAVT